MQEQENKGVAEENKEFENMEEATGTQEPVSAAEEAQLPEPLFEHREESPASVSKLEERLTEAEDKYLRLYSEFENFRRRTAKERIDLISSANGELLKALLPVVDDLERAVRSFDETHNLEALAEGVKLVQAKMSKSLESKGLKPFTSKGETFTPDMHEAITQVPVEGMKGKVIDEIEKGYMLHDKVLRFAKVVIGA